MIHQYDSLEQYYFVDGKYIELKSYKYSTSIGMFIIKFSELENELNTTIADEMADNLHEIGFSLIADFSFSQKINFFYNRCLQIETYTKKETINLLKKIKQDLEKINVFRNIIAHANWQSLTKDGFIHTKIVLDKEDASVKFKKIKIAPYIINKNTSKIDVILNQISKYTISLYQR